MDEGVKQTQDAVEPQGGEQQVVEPQGGSVDPMELERLKSEIEELRKQNQQLFARLRKAQETHEESEEREETRQPEETDKLAELEAKLSNQAAAVEELVELRLQGYNRDEIQYIVNYAVAQGKTPLEVVNDPFVVGGIERMRALQKAKETATSSEKPVGDKPKPFREMTREERKQWWETQVARQAEEFF